MTNVIESDVGQLCAGGQRCSIVFALAARNHITHTSRGLSSIFSRNNCEVTENARPVLCWPKTLEAHEEDVLGPDEAAMDESEQAVQEESEGIWWSPWFGTRGATWLTRDTRSA